MRLPWLPALSLASAYRVCVWRQVHGFVVVGGLCVPKFSATGLYSPRKPAVDGAGIAYVAHSTGVSAIDTQWFPLFRILWTQVRTTAVHVTCTVGGGGCSSLCCSLTLLVDQQALCVSHGAFAVALPLTPLTVMAAFCVAPRVGRFLDSQQDSTGEAYHSTAISPNGAVFGATRQGSVAAVGITSSFITSHLRPAIMAATVDVTNAAALADLAFLCTTLVVSLEGYVSTYPLTLVDGNVLSALNQSCSAYSLVRAGLNPSGTPANFVDYRDPDEFVTGASGLLQQRGARVMLLFAVIRIICHEK